MACNAAGIIEIKMQGGIMTYQAFHQTIWHFQLVLYHRAKHEKVRSKPATLEGTQKKKQHGKFEE